MSDYTSKLSPEALSFWNYFESAGANLICKKQFKDLYAFDFLVVGYDDLYAHVNIGIHVTTKQDDVEAMQRFVNGANRGICLKALYIEIDPATVDAGAQVVAFGAILHFLFERSAEDERCRGLRIYQDCSLQYFHLANNMNRLARASNAGNYAIGEAFRGRITHYFTDRGFGFIQISPERKFFIHIANIVDDRLRAMLANYTVGESIPVEFQFGGCDGGKYPKAINVVIDDSIPTSSHFESEAGYDSTAYKASPLSRDPDFSHDSDFCNDSEFDYDSSADYDMSHYHYPD